MFGLIYKTLSYFFAGNALNKGERDQPPPLKDQEQHLIMALAKVRREMLASEDSELHTQPRGEEEQ